MNYDICIVGGGASGLAAAIAALQAEPGRSVLILEKNREAGRKIRATGSGRCNITNAAAEGYLRVLTFFRSVGIATRTYPNGLVYPYSESAADVQEALVAAVTSLGGIIELDATVVAAEPAASSDGGGAADVTDGATDRGPAGFVVTYQTHADDGAPVVRTCTADRLILAAGGKAGPQYGTVGDGYKLAAAFGHEVVKPIPVLTQVECAGDGCEPLSGIRARGRVSLYRRSPDGLIDNGAPAPESTEQLLFEEDGEIQFTFYGLSGIAVFNMTRMMRLTGGLKFADFSVGINLYPEDDVTGFLLEKRSLGGTAASLLNTVLKPALADYVLARAGIDRTAAAARLSDADVARIAGTVHDLRFTPTGLHGWKDAQCTSGGVTLTEVDPDTCESLLCKGLYLTGELLDYDGPCGGFNLTHAWLTGINAGRAAVASLRDR